MFKHVFIIVFLSGFFSCSTQNTTESKISESKILRSETDTICTARGTLYFTDTTDVISKITVPDTSEQKNLLANREIVSRYRDTLKIKLKNGGTKTYVNSPPDSGSGHIEDYSDFRYCGKLNDINYHLLFVSYHESFSYLLLNAVNGKETYTCGSPEISPDHTKIICGCFDLQAGFVFNGLQLFEVKKDSLYSVWSRELTKWGPGRLCWVNNNELLAEKLSLDSASGEVITTFVKLSTIK